jgi:hypothetical protein
LKLRDGIDRLMQGQGCEDEPLERLGNATRRVRPEAVGMAPLAVVNFFV